MEQLKTNAIPLLCGNETAYLTKLTYGGLFRLVNDDILYVANNTDSNDFAQRKPIPGKVAEIAVHILSEFVEFGTVFFAPICINICPAPTLLDDHWLLLPYSVTALHRNVDGQHRSAGIRLAIQILQNPEALNKLLPGKHHNLVKQLLKQLDATALERLCKIEIGIMVFANLPLSRERQIFRNFNLLATRPDATLCHSFDSSSPTTAIAHQIIDSCYWLSGNVKMLSGKLNNDDHYLMTFGTLIGFVESFFPRIEDKDLTPYSIYAIGFLESVAKNLPEGSWEAKTPAERAAQREQSLLAQAILFRALGKLGNDFRNREITPEEMPLLLQPLKEVNWDRVAPIWQDNGIVSVNPSTGKATIANTKAFIDRLHKHLRKIIFG